MKVEDFSVINEKYVIGNKVNRQLRFLVVRKFKNIKREQLILDLTENICNIECVRVKYLAFF